VLEVDAATSGGVEQVRAIKESCHFSHDGDWRVVILDEAHSMSKEAYTALLKTLEEPPPNTVFILVTTEPDKILGTVRSRSMPFEFRRIKTADLVDRLRYIAHCESLEVDDALLLEISKTAQGGLRDAVMLLDQITLVGISDVEGFRSFFGIQDYSLSLMWAALRGDHAEGYRLVTDYFSRTGDASGMVSDLSRLVSELLVIKSEGRPVHYGEESLSERVEMAQAVETEALVRVCEILWELRSRVRVTENDQHSSMEMGFALIANSVKPASGHVVAPSQPILTTTSEEKLSLAEISDFTSGR
jgi:DNA polymerase-3 subunit gamma/tau